jgi:hypothetical protein
MDEGRVTSDEGRETSLPAGKAGDEGQGELGIEGRKHFKLLW